MKSSWRRFRALPVAAQAGAWALVAAVYTVALVLVLSGGDGAKSATKPLPVATTELERKLQRVVQRLPVRRSQPEDVVDFRTPRLRTVRCEGASCQVDYVSGLPGTGRLLEDQQQIVREAFLKLGILELRITAYRGSPRETGVPPKPNEETPSGQVLASLTCSRTRVSEEQLRELAGFILQSRACEVRGAENGGPLKERGGPGTDAGDQGLTGPPP